MSLSGRDMPAARYVPCGTRTISHRRSRYIAFAQQIYRIAVRRYIARQQPYIAKSRPVAAKPQRYKFLTEFAICPSRDAICLRRDMSLAGREQYRIGAADISHLRSKYIASAQPIYRTATAVYRKKHPTGCFFLPVRGLFVKDTCLRSRPARLFAARCFRRS